MNKKLASVFLSAAVVAAMFSGCTSGNTSSTGSVSSQTSGGSSTETAGTASTVTMTGWYTEENMQPIIDKVNEVLGGRYQLEYSYITLDDYNNVLSTQLAAGEGPDVLVDGTNFPARIKAGNLKDITGSARLEGFNEAGMALCTSKDGKVYGIPSYGWFSGLFYNKDILEANGITELPTTFNELIEVFDKLAANGVKPIAFGLADSDKGLHSLMGYIECSFYQASEEGKAFDSEFSYGRAKLDGTLNQYVQEWSVLIEKGHITPEMVGISGDQALNEFITGEAAMYNDGPWDYTVFEEAGLNVGVLPHLGSDPSIQYLLGGPAASLGINVNAKNPEGAEAVLDAFASVEVQQVFADANVGGFSYKQGVQVQMPEAYDTVKPILDAGNVACSWERWGVNMPAQSLVDELIAQLQGLVTGDLTVDTFLQALDSKADSIRYTE